MTTNTTTTTRRDLALQLERLGWELARLADEVDSLPGSAPLGVQVQRAAADVAQVVEGLRDGDWGG